ncbi:MAG TPA: hypothetical protein VLA91_16055 [Acidimicrobiia bacterium]|nr:hypothetical protein [Acidimicrobiia bacterium]
MSRLLAQAVLVATATGAALTQLDSTQELLVWELLLVGVVIWQIRGLPGVLAPADPPLFDLTPREPRRLPRAVASMELSVIDAISGHLGPERRLQPSLERIATHRLQRQGIDFSSPKAVAALGDEEWSWLATPKREPPSPELLETIVARLEGM